MYITTEYLIHMGNGLFLVQDIFWGKDYFGSKISKIAQN